MWSWLKSFLEDEKSINQVTETNSNKNADIIMLGSYPKSFSFPVNDLKLCLTHGQSRIHQWVPLGINYDYSVKYEYDEKNLYYEMSGKVVKTYPYFKRATMGLNYHLNKVSEMPDNAYFYFSQKQIKMLDLDICQNENIPDKIKKDWQDKIEKIATPDTTDDASN